MAIPTSALVDALGEGGGALTSIAHSLTLVTTQVRMRGRRGGTGSGIVWRGDGLVVTNAHVARGDRAIVELSDGRAFDGRVLERDTRHDLAALRIEADGLQAARIGDSRQLRPGELVVACGHPFGIANVVTAGVVHTVRARPAASGERWIRADVALAPGNSGGPLANAAGEIVGVNAMIVSGLAFAVPSHVVERFLKGEGARGALGVSVQAVAIGGARTGAPGTIGLLVLAVDPGKAAEAAGLMLGDVLIAVDGTHFCATDDLLDALAPGRTATLDVVRGGRTVRLLVTPRARAA